MLLVRLRTTMNILRPYRENNPGLRRRIKLERSKVAYNIAEGSPAIVVPLAFNMKVSEEKHETFEKEVPESCLTSSPLTASCVVTPAIVSPHASTPRSVNRPPEMGRLTSMAQANKGSDYFCSQISRIP